MSPRTQRQLLGLYLAGLALIVGTILWLNDGGFSYSLDDPYIHLALAENLAAGHHGLNATEPSSPSSSILWPLLLAPFARFEWFHLAPLLLAIGSMVGVLLCLLRFFGERLARHLRPAGQVAVLLALMLGLNFWGMPLNGMEHSLQLLLTCWVAVGLIDLVEDDRVRPTLLAGLALGPLVRYENLSLLVVGALVLAMRRHRVRAIAVVVLPVATIAAHSSLLHAQRLPWLPSSVLNKSAVVAAAGPLSIGLEIAENVLEGLAKDRVLAILTLLFILAARSRRLPPGERRSKELIYGAIVGAALGAHLAAGRYDWLGRYEIYLLLLAAVVLLHVFGAALGRLIGERRRLALAGLALAALVVGENQLRATVTTPISAANTYATNFQMRRLTVDYWGDRVAVTDIGRVSLRNPHYVLDLWGIGSETARRWRQEGEGTDWADRLAEAYGVDLLLVDLGWFRELGPLPAGWEPVAELGTSYSHGYGGGPHTVILREPARRDELMAALEAFEPTLPSGSRLRIGSRERRAGLLGELARVDPGDDAQRVAVVELAQHVVR